MIKLTQEQILMLHTELISATGGTDGVRDFGLLSSALNAPFQQFDNKDLFPTIQQKAARLGYGLIKNHAFVDGNKRIGMYVLLTFLEINGVRIHPTVDDVARVGLAVASGKMQYEDLLQWIIDNK